MERRDFLKVVSLSAVLAGTGVALTSCNPAQTAGEVAETVTDTVSDTLGLSVDDDAPEVFSVSGEPADVKFSNKTDVLVVGSGIAGLSAAYPLAKAGKSVIIAEKLELLGGQAVNSNGIVHVAGTTMQRDAGVSVDVDAAWAKRETHLKALGIGGLTRAKELFFAATEWADTLVADCGATFSDPSTYSDDGLNEDFLLPKNGIGDMASVMQPLRDTLMDLGVTFLTGHRASAFISGPESGICGMRFIVEKATSIVDIQADRVIVATGGFSSSQEYVHQYAPGWEQAGAYTFSATGDGLRFCTIAGGAVDGAAEAVYLTSDIPWAAEWGRFAPTLIVDAVGERFAREDEVTEVAAACFKNVRGLWWTIFDNKLAECSQGRSVAEVTSKNKPRLVGPCNTESELAEAMGLEADTLDDVFEEYAKIVKRGSDVDYGRTAQLEELEKPYYALKQRPVRFMTLGGPTIDGNGRMLNAAGLPVEHVYCCGAVANGGGEGIASCGTCGMLVGQAVLEDLEEAAKIAAEAEAEAEDAAAAQSADETSADEAQAGAETSADETT